MFTKRIDLPRCDEMDGSSLRILPRYTEAGYFCEANALWITDGIRTAVYVPLVLSDVQEAETSHHLRIDNQAGSYEPAK